MIRQRRASVITGILTVGAISLIPWIAYLAATLQSTYVAQNWDLTWTGFDVALMIMLGTTAVLTRSAHRLVGMTSVATAMLLMCDAWFDWSTSAGVDHTWATWTALIVELPMAALLMVNALRQPEGYPLSVRSPRLAEVGFVERSDRLPVASLQA